MSESETRALEIAAATEQVERDLVFAALQAAGAPVLAAAGEPLRIFYLNEAARAVFGADLDAINDLLFGARATTLLRLRELAQSEAMDAAPRLERVELPFRGRSKNVTVLCKNIGETEGAPACFVMATLGLRSGQEGAEKTGRNDIRRFLWRTDAGNRFVEATQALADAVGAEHADIVGRDVRDVARSLGIDAEERLARAFSQTKSWSGIEVQWPLEKGGAVSTTLGAVPIFDEDRRFTGFRGYGVLRFENESADARAKPSPDAPAAEAPEPPPPAPSAYANVIPLRPLAAAPRSEEPVKAKACETIEPSAEPELTAKEKDAFEEIARALEGAAELASARIEYPEFAEERALSAQESETGERPGDEETLKRHAGAIVDRLPVGVLVARGASLLYVNRTLLEYLDYPDREAFEADGGLDRVFLDPAFGRDVAEDEGLGAIGISTRFGEEIGFEAQLQTIDWDENGPAALITLQRAPPPAAKENIAAVNTQTAARLEAERASAAKSDFLARVSHEIRTPLSAILGFAEVMMEERFGPIANERYKEYLNDIHVSGAHVLSLVNDLLDLSKIEAGKLNLEFEGVDVNAVISECASIMQAQASRARVVMRLSLSPRLPRVRADQRSLKQILLNLLSNAVKFNQRGGQVIVSSALTETGAVMLRVKDTGIGMSNDEIKTALEPFEQLGPASEVSGTGLGLPVTKALVEANHASFSIQSRKNEGTLVEIAFAPPQVLAAE
jgi:signal transduction histidine kinase